MKYKCTTKCFYKSRLYSVGEVLLADENETPPKHFVLSSKFRKPVVDQKVKDQKAVEALGHTKDTSERPEEIERPKPSMTRRRSDKNKDKDEDFLK